MGYRSKVIIVISNEIEVPVNLFKIDNTDFFDKSMSNDFANYYTWNNVKWYDTYDYVINIMEFLNGLNDEDYGFMRIGGYDDDFETLGSPVDFGLIYTRDIIIDL